MTCLAQSKTILLWDKVPNQSESDEKEVINKNDIIRISNVQNPSIEVFLTKNKTKSNKMVILLPGGGYGNLSYDYEGTDFAEWLNSKGINAAVLKYRLPNSKTIKKSYLAPLQDAQRAIKLVRSYANEWEIDTNKIGVIGFSAGGHLASTLGTHFQHEVYRKTDSIDNLSAKPNFMGLIYPVISMKEGVTHNGSKLNLLGKNPSEEMIKLFSNELQITTNTPPTFLLHATDDPAVPVENSLLFYKALKEHKIPVELHIYALGGHGFAFGKDFSGLENWTELFYKWLMDLQ